MPDNWDEKKLSHSNPIPKPDSVPATAREHAIGSRGIPFGSGLGKYRILDRIRTSHHAIIYNARDAMLDRLVVIKQLNPGLLDDPLACGDFKREAQLLARVPKDARNVIGIHELIGDDQGLFIVEEFVSGDWLEMLISKRKVGLADALRLLKYGCLGMRALHSRKIVHRDMQPTSLLISPNGQVRIGNFACAVHEGDHTPPPIIQTKYAAPELQLGMPHDDRVDIYSLGMTVYEVCVGRRALHSHFSAICIDAQASVERWRQWHGDMSTMLPNARAMNPAVPPALAAILQKMTSKDVDERYASAEEVLQDIIRKFTTQRANVAPALQRAAAPQLVASFASVAQSPSATSAPQSALPQPSSLLHLVKPERATSTHTVNVEPKQGTVEQPCLTAADQPPMPLETRKAAPKEENARPDIRRQLPPPSFAPPRSKEVLRPRSVSTPVRPKSMPKSVPAPAPVAEPPKKQRRVLMPIAICIALTASIVAGGRFLWVEYGQRPSQKTVHSMIDEGMSLYRAENFQKAREAFLKVIVKAEADPQLAAEWNQADTMLLLVDGQLALQRDDFEKVEKLLSEAGVRGVDVASLSILRSRFQAKRDAMRLSAEGVKAVDAGRFIDAETRVTDYEQNAKVAGLDPDTLKNKVQQERENREYDQALNRARKALEENDFDAATLALRDAQVIRNTTATRQLRQDIMDAKSRHDWMVRGDKAVNERDFAAAEAAYQSANAVDPTDEIEEKLKMASSMRLLNDASDNIREGKLLEAKKKLENALWKYPNKAARAKLNALTKAFEAAQLVENGDQEFTRGNYEEAIRLYDKAIPDLVAPADEMAKAKRQEAKQRQSESAKG